MNRTPRRVAAITGTIVGMTGAALLSYSTIGQAHPTLPRLPQQQLTPGQVAPAPQQTRFACERSGKPVCNPNPAVRATDVASDPLAEPPSANPMYLTRDQAIREARGPAPVTSIVHAAFMKYGDYQKLPTDVNFAVNPERMVWVVTVHADVWTRGSLVRKPELKHVYTVVIDAETGMVSDSCIGCALISSDTPGPAAVTPRTSIRTAHGKRGRH